MSDTDEMTDSPELRDLRGAFAGVDLPTQPSLAAIARAGRRHRRHRVYGGTAALSVAAVATGAALTLGPNDPDSVAPPSTLGTIRTAAYTIVGNADGTATLTMQPEELFDPDALQRDLAHYGIQAEVTVGSFCSSKPAPDGFKQVVSFDPGGRGVPAAVTIDPAAMPADTVLSIGELELPHAYRMAAITLASVALIDPAAQDCTTKATPDDPNDPVEGLRFVMIPASTATP